MTDLCSPCAEGVKAHNGPCWKLLTNKEQIQHGGAVLPTALQPLYVTPALSSFGGWQIRLRGAELWNVSWIFSGKISMVRVILKHAWLGNGTSPPISCGTQICLPMLSTQSDSSIHLLMTGTRCDAIPLLCLIWTRMLISSRVRYFWEIYVVKHKLVALV